MEKIIVNGGNRLTGEVDISGAKNAVVAIIPATILAEGVCRIENIPNISDVSAMIKVLRSLGAEIKMINKSTIEVDTSCVRTNVVGHDLTKLMRASYYFIGVLLGRFNHAKVAMPGGCCFGVRPIDQHIKGFEAIGARVSMEENAMVDVYAETLLGNSVYFDVVSVGATINLMLAAVKAKGLTVIENAAKEPHIVDLANFLNSMGADVRGAGTDVIKIRGVDKLHGCEYAIIPDQIEAGTFMMAAAATKGDVLIKNVIPKHLEAITSKLIEIGATVDEFDDAVRVRATERLHSTNIKTLPYPGFPTDMQPQMAVTLALSDGTSIITESIFENRFKYVNELARMGASIKVEGNVAVINGVSSYVGASVVAPDLRAGAALVIAGLVADGFTVIDDIKYIQRGYEKFSTKLRALGGQIERVESEKDIRKFKLKTG